MRVVVTGLLVIEAFGFAAVATVHLGVPLVALLICLALLSAAALRLGSAPLADTATITTVAFAIATVAAVMVVGPHTDLNDAAHRAALLSLVATGLLQMTSAGSSIVAT